VRKMEKKVEETKPMELKPMEPGIPPAAPRQ
jgi:hypothetical protein